MTDSFSSAGGDGNQEEQIRQLTARLAASEAAKQAAEARAAKAEARAIEADANAEAANKARFFTSLQLSAEVSPSDFSDSSVASASSSPQTVSGTRLTVRTDNSRLGLAPTVVQAGLLDSLLPPVEPALVLTRWRVFRTLFEEAYRSTVPPPRTGSGSFERDYVQPLIQLLLRAVFDDSASGTRVVREVFVLDSQDKQRSKPDFAIVYRLDAEVTWASILAPVETKPDDVTPGDQEKAGAIAVGRLWQAVAQARSYARRVLFRLAVEADERGEYVGGIGMLCVGTTGTRIVFSRVAVGGPSPGMTYTQFYGDATASPRSLWPVLQSEALPLLETWGSEERWSPPEEPPAGFAALVRMAVAPPAAYAPKQLAPLTQLAVEWGRAAASPASGGLPPPPASFPLSQRLGSGGTCDVYCVQPEVAQHFLRQEEGARATTPGPHAPAEPARAAPRAPARGPEPLPLAPSPDVVIKLPRVGSAKTEALCEAEARALRALAQPPTPQRPGARPIGVLPVLLAEGVRVRPLDAELAASSEGSRRRVRVLALSPKGQPLGRELARQLAACGGDAAAEATCRRRFADAVLGDVLCALEFAHGRRLAHRDIRAANVVWAAGRAVLVDWALSTRIPRPPTDGRLQAAAEAPPEAAAEGGGESSGESSVKDPVGLDLLASAALWVTLAHGTLAGDQIVLRVPTSDSRSPPQSADLPANPVVAEIRRMEDWLAGTCAGGAGSAEAQVGGESSGAQLLRDLRDEVLPTLRRRQPQQRDASRLQSLTGWLMRQRGGGGGSGGGGSEYETAKKAEAAARGGPGRAWAAGVPRAVRTLVRGIGNGTAPARENPNTSRLVRA